MFLPLLFGIIGCAILVALGVWQVQRLQWKNAVLADITARISAAPVPLPAAPDPESDRFLPVRVTGTTTGDEVNVLVSTKSDGAGYRVISAFVTDQGRRILVDEGFIRTTEKDIPRPPTPMTVTGNLHWPAETDSFTPNADTTSNIWFARDVPLMATALDTDPILVVARTVTGTDARATPLPVDTVGIPNDHLKYAVTWFGLALVWAGMTAFLLWRIHRPTA
jgi:surfeit locus 1 family protein